LELLYVADSSCTEQILMKKEFGFAFQNYVFGKWTQSVMQFRELVEKYPQTKPAQFLINYMSKFEDKEGLIPTPSNWTGFRMLSE
jgi:hypothetical protein